MSLDSHLGCPSSASRDAEVRVVSSNPYDRETRAAMLIGSSKPQAAAMPGQPYTTCSRPAARSGGGRLMPDR